MLFFYFILARKKPILAGLAIHCENDKLSVGMEETAEFYCNFTFKGYLEEDDFNKVEETVLIFQTVLVFVYYELTYGSSFCTKIFLLHLHNVQVTT